MAVINDRVRRLRSRRWLVVRLGRRCHQCEYRVHQSGPLNIRKLNALAEAMERTPYDDLADRVSRLEQGLTQLKKEGRRMR